jgi:hypothetical protein
MDGCVGEVRAGHALWQVDLKTYKLLRFFLPAKIFFPDNITPTNHKKYYGHAL